MDNKNEIVTIIENVINIIEENKDNSQCYEIYNTAKKNIYNLYNYTIENANIIQYTASFNRLEYIKYLNNHLKILKEL
jgi:hypothetical protein